MWVVESIFGIQNSMFVNPFQIIYKYFKVNPRNFKISFADAEDGGKDGLVNFWDL